MAGCYTLAEAVQLVLADSDDDIDCAADDVPDAPDSEPEDLPNQDIIPESDSDASVHQDSDDESDHDDGGDDVAQEPGGAGDALPTRNPNVVWSQRQPQPRGRPLAANIMRGTPGPTHLVLMEINKPIDAFTLTLTSLVVELVLQHTNERYEQYCVDHADSYISRRFGGYIPFRREEGDAFSGLLLIMGVFKSSKRLLNELWDPLQPPHFRATTSRQRFALFLRFCRFDDATTRVDRRRDDRFAPIREDWDMFIDRCRALYNSGPNVTVDEQLVKFRGRCLFRQYMPNKPGKYGLKIWVATDAGNSYCYNAKPYLGREENRPAEGLPFQVVTDLVAPLYNSGRNVTMDRYFSSIPLARHLLNNNLTMVGTIMANRRDLPVDLLPAAAKGREIGSTKLAFMDQLTLASFHPKKANTVLMLSTFHHDDAIGRNNKPEIIRFYNSTKWGVDVLDQKCRHYTAYRATFRWPMAIFTNIIDIAGINAHILYETRQARLAASARPRKPMSRYSFLKSVGEDLIRPLMPLRAQYPNGLNVPTKLTLQTFGFTMDQRVRRATIPEEVDRSKKVCFTCPQSRKRKVRQSSDLCRRHVCNEHSTTSLRCHQCE